MPETRTPPPAERAEGQEGTNRHKPKSTKRGGGGGGKTQTREAAGAETAQDKQARTLQTSYEPSRPLLDRSLKDAIEGEVLSI